jgi:probable rRNA maturation factor
MASKSLMKYQLDLAVQFGSPSLEKTWAERLPSNKMKKWVRSAIQRDAKFVIRLVGNAESKKLNHTYRGQNHATNILTFTLHENDSSGPLEADLILCMPVIVREAKEQGKDVLDHFAHLIIHGALHAQGFDHEDETDALAMESLEIAILRSLKINNPYV